MGSSEFGEVGPKLAIFYDVVDKLKNEKQSKFILEGILNV